MNIGFDASDLCTDRADGTTRYTRELLSRLPVLMPKHEISVFAPCNTQGANYDQPTNLRWHSSPFPKYWTQVRLPFDLLRYRPDVLLMPIQQLPILRPPGMKTVSVIHDLAFHNYPEHFTYKDWLLLHTFTAQAAREADHIIAVSQSTADDVRRYYGRSHNVSVIHHGVDHSIFHPPSEAEGSDGRESLVAKYPGLASPYFLYVGQIQPRKNIVRLVEALENLRDGSTYQDHQLVIAGGHGWLRKSIVDRIEASPVKESIHLLERVSNELLPSLYWNADVFALPSLYEGFGIPLLEAMACGTPVLSSNISSMPEVVGNAGVIVDPNNVQSIADGLTEASLRSDELSKRGIERAKNFSWNNTVAQVVDILEKMV